MKIILLKKIEKLENVGKIVEVKDGYAKNYLIPQRKALLANKKNILQQKDIFKTKKNNIDFTNIYNTLIFIPVTAKDNNELYVTYNKSKITKIFKKLNINIKEKNIIKDVFIKKLGTYEIEIKEYNKENAKINLIFTKKNK